MGRYVGEDLRRHAHRRVAGELRALADRIEAGDLPEAGTAVDLARKIERMVKEQRPAKNPGERTKQARALAGMLSKRTGAKVRLLYHAGRGGSTRIGTYTVEWANGPTSTTIRQLVTEVAGQVPALDVKQLSYSRSHGTRVEVACLLRHFDAHPEEGRSVSLRRSVGHGREGNGLDRFAREVARDVEYPERIDEETARRVKAVYSLDSHGRVDGITPTTDAWLKLGDHLTSHGWPATRAWLDEIAATEGDGKPRSDETTRYPE
ncbi:hypothetical protein ABN028_30940 [Actinopolymorpha sp. B17G11]|uniref:hypothetical protein n=1 Tax=Actinopolymorpha sp. B17G11 TaxID=3160861 RepID=UPI0032E3D903